MELSISHTDCRLGMESTRAKLDVHIRNARLDLVKRDARLNIERDPPRVLIDQYQCFAEEGLKNNYDLLKEASSRAYQHFMEHIEKTNADGRALAAVERGGNPIADIAARDSSPVHEFGLGFIPQSRPKIDVTGGIRIEPAVDENGLTYSIKGTYTPWSVDANYMPGKLDIYVTQYPAVNIEYVGNNIDTTI